MLKFTDDHEWIRIEGDMATIGITDHAQSELGDIVYVELPDIGAQLGAGDDMATVESIKAASSVYAPLAGEVIETNAELQSEPGLVNSDAMGAAWFVKLKLADASAADSLLDEDGYKALIS